METNDSSINHKEEENANGKCENVMAQDQVDKGGAKWLSNATSVGYGVFLSG